MSMLAERLPGAWALQDWRIDYAGGRVEHPFGPDAVGMLIYATNGWMSATMSQRQRTPLSAGSARQADPATLARAMQEYVAYVARWWVEGTSIVHEVAFSMNPVLIGTRLAREATLDGPELRLIAREGDGAKQRVHHLLWVRPEARDPHVAVRSP